MREFWSEVGPNCQSISALPYACIWRGQKIKHKKTKSKELPLTQRIKMFWSKTLHTLKNRQIVAAAIKNGISFLGLLTVTKLVVYFFSCFMPLVPTEKYNLFHSAWYTGKCYVLLFLMPCLAFWPLVPFGECNKGASCSSRMATLVMELIPVEEVLQCHTEFSLAHSFVQ